MKNLLFLIVLYLYIWKAFYFGNRNKQIFFPLDFFNTLTWINIKEKNGGYSWKFVNFKRYFVFWSQFRIFRFLIVLPVSSQRHYYVNFHGKEMLKWSLIQITSYEENRLNWHPFYSFHEPELWNTCILVTISYFP